MIVWSSDSSPINGRPETREDDDDDDDDDDDCLVL